MNDEGESKKLDALNVVLEKIKFAVAASVSPEFLDSITLDYYDTACQHFTHVLQWWIWGREVTESVESNKTLCIKYPKTWWDAFKERWYPKFLKQRYPINYVEINEDVIIYHKTFHVCPHLPIGLGERAKIHLDYLDDGDSS